MLIILMTLKENIDLLLGGNYDYSFNTLLHLTNLVCIIRKSYFS